MSVGHAMRPMIEAHFAIQRRHMVEVIGIQVDLASEELGKAAARHRQDAAIGSAATEQPLRLAAGAQQNPVGAARNDCRGQLRRVDARWSAQACGLFG